MSCAGGNWYRHIFGKMMTSQDLIGDDETEIGIR